MIPILFAKNSTTFTSNGIGRLSDAVSCVVTEVLNGQYELALKYPADGAFFDNIEMNSIIVSRHEDSIDLQPFEVYKISKPINGVVTINAHHITYRLSKCVAMPFAIEPGATACADALAGLKSHAAVADDVALFSFWTNVTTAGTYSQIVPASIRSRLGGVEGSILDQFGGEYEWDGFTVKLHNQRGNANTGITLRYGKNITDIQQEKNISNTITGVIPFWSNMDGTDYVDLPEKVVYSTYASQYPYHFTAPLDLSDEWDETPSENSLRLAAEAFVNNSKLGLPAVSISVSFVALWQTEEYKDIAPLERVKLGDTVTVSFDKLGIEEFARVVQTEYNVLTERYNEVQIGQTRSTLAQTLNDQNSKTIQSMDYVKRQATDYVNNATKWLTTAGGYVIAIKNADGSWKELIFSDITDPYSQNAHILRINNNGIGFSNSGMNGTFTNAWTIDGNLIADFIHGGTLTLGGAGNVNGWIRVLDARGNEIGWWSKDGASITGTVAAKAGGAEAYLRNGMLDLFPVNDHNAIHIERGNKKLSMGEDNFYVERPGVATSCDWGTLAEIAHYWEDHGSWS